MIDRSYKFSILKEMRIFVVFLLLILTSCSGRSSLLHNHEQGFRELDRSIDQRAEALRRKQDAIDEAKAAMARNALDYEQRYHSCLDLVELYRGFQCDSLIKYCHKSISLAECSGNSNEFAYAKMLLAYYLARSGMHMESLEVIQSVNRKDIAPSQLDLYYWIHCIIYRARSAISKDPIIINSSYRQQVKQYKDSLETVLSPDFRYYYDAQISSLNEEGRYEDIIKLSREQLSRMSSQEERNCASVYYHIAEAYLMMNDQDGYLDALLKSATLDMRYCVNDHASLHEIARTLFSEGDVSRSARYMQICMDDALYYNANLRGLQISSTLPIVIKAFAGHNHRQIIILSTVSTIAVILLMVSVIFLFTISSQKKKLSQAEAEVRKVNHHLNDVNSQLTESNYIKESYVARFIQQNSDYMSKTHNDLTLINKAIRNRNFDEALRLSFAPERGKDDITAFYEEFDDAFLSIFPDFVKEFNKLLQDEYKYNLDDYKNGKKTLTSELRVYALIRLGFNDSATIASMLRYSVNSIYNIRSRAKAKSILPKEEFEDNVKRICVLSDQS